MEGGLPLCWGAVGEFYSPSRLGNTIFSISNGYMNYYHLLYKLVVLNRSNWYREPLQSMVIIIKSEQRIRETWVQSLVQSYQRLKKWYLIPPCLTLSVIRYVSRLKWITPGKGVVPSSSSRCSSYWKGSLWVALDYGHQLYFDKKLCNCTYVFFGWWDTAT